MKKRIGNLFLAKYYDEYKLIAYIIGRFISCKDGMKIWNIDINNKDLWYKTIYAKTTKRYNLEKNKIFCITKNIKTEIINYGKLPEQEEKELIDKLIILGSLEQIEK